MRIGIITGSGTYSISALEQPSAADVDTRFGTVTLTSGSMGGADVVHVSRHGPGHTRLSNHVAHRANILALKQARVDAVLAVTVCGAVDAALALGALIVFDDLHFISNRLPDGGLCTLHDEPGAAGRGHWVYERPFSEPLRAALMAACTAVGRPPRDGGCYGHVDGPRFNTRAEIAMLAGCGVTAVSQTAGPETVLAGEARLPYALLGFATDYANGVSERPTPVSELIEQLDASVRAFAETLASACAALAAAPPPEPVGTVLEFE